MHYEHYYRRGQIPIELSKAVEADLSTRAAAAAAGAAGARGGRGLAAQAAPAAPPPELQEPFLVDMQGDAEQGEDNDASMGMCAVS